MGYEATLYKADAGSLAAFTSVLDNRDPARAKDRDKPFTLVVAEFPGNPLLQATDVAAVQAAARRYGIPVVVDDTVGTHASARLLPHCDAVCTSLTKMFSGACNVMGGAVALNPRSPHREVLRRALLRLCSSGSGSGSGPGRDDVVVVPQSRDSEAGSSGSSSSSRSGDTSSTSKKNMPDPVWFWQDMVVMEGNSRDFASRTARASANAAFVAGLLRADRSGAVAEVYYPQGGATQDVYDRYRVAGAGYGMLLTVRLTSQARAAAFYDALDVAKGPTLGTNFTLSCAYTALAHYRELDWAAEYGVTMELVRISVGLEEREWLEERVRRALRAAGECREDYLAIT